METSIFDCSICCFQYNDTNRKPLSLPCGHVYCQDCIFKLIKGDQSKPSIPSEIRKNLVLDEMQTQIICPSDNIVHKVIPSSLPICYIIIQHLPKSKEGRDITTCYTNRLPTAASDFSNEESEKYRKDFRHLLKQFTEEYRSSKHWEETIRQVEKRHTENNLEQISVVNDSFDKARVFLNEKKQKLLSEIKLAFEKEKEHIDREKYKRK